MIFHAEGKRDALQTNVKMQSFRHERKKLRDYSTAGPERIGEGEGVWNKNIKGPQKRAKKAEKL